MMLGAFPTGKALFVIIFTFLLFVNRKSLKMPLRKQEEVRSNSRVFPFESAMCMRETVYQNSHAISKILIIMVWADITQQNWQFFLPELFHFQGKVKHLNTGY